MTRILLTGAGFSHNWGGWVASEAFEYLLGCTEIDEETRHLLWRNKESGGGFEGTLADLANAKDDESKRRLKDLTDALVAHLSFPYLVFDTTTRKEFAGQKPRRMTWTVHASKRTNPIEVVDHASKLFERSVRPWPVSYNCRVVISVRTFQIDIIKSIYGSEGYFFDQN